MELDSQSFEVSNPYHMTFTIHTLEIEKARLMSSIRAFESATLTEADFRGGRHPSRGELELHILELNKAIEVLKNWSEENEFDAAIYNDFGRRKFEQY